MKNQAGLSLVELMISLLISSILLLGVIELFNNSNASDHTNSAIARVQESGRIALEVIGADARRAGYQGCSSATTKLTVNGIKFPDQAVTALNKSVTFNYAVTDNTGTPFSTNKTCDDKSLYLKSATYSQCANGTSLCLDGDPILDNTTIATIDFGILNGNDISWIESATVTAADLAQARSVRISLTIKNASDASEQISRNYSSTYQLRNRF